MKKDIISILDLSKKEFEEVVSLAADLKRKRADGDKSETEKGRRDTLS